MVTIDRKLAGIIPYKTIFFPTEDALHQVTQNLRSIEMARAFYTHSAVSTGRCLLKHELGFTVCNDLRQSKDQLWNNFKDYDRYEIRRAERLGSRVRITRNENDAEEKFLALFNDFARAKSGVWPISKQVVQRFRHNADILVVHLDERPFVVNLVLLDPDSRRVRGLYNASIRLSVNDRKETRLVGNLNRLLHWRNMCLYKDEGFELYDWRGISEDGKDGRSRFKLSFGGEVRRQHTYLCAGSPMFGRFVLASFARLSKRGRGGVSIVMGS